MPSQILKIIGNGQITIPQEWRIFLNLEGNAVKAKLENNKIVIESLEVNQDKEWDIEHITLNKLPASDQKIIKKGRKAYHGKKKEKFQTLNEFLTPKCTTYSSFNPKPLKKTAKKSSKIINTFRNSPTFSRQRL